MASNYAQASSSDRDGNGFYRSQPGYGTGPFSGSGARGGGSVGVRGNGSDSLRPPDPNDVPGLSNLDELMEAVRLDYEQITRELGEIKLLARQASDEVDRANQRKTQMVVRVREMEARLETFARQEIRTTYLASGEADMRVFMMQEQRDRLQDKQRAFERYERSLQLVVNTLQRIQADRQKRGEDLDPALANLSRVVHNQEQLRQRIAQRLHDGPAQALANVVLSAEICERAMNRDPDRARDELMNLKSVVSTTLQETRKFIFDLRPMTLDDLGLIPTLKRYTQDMAAKSGIQIFFSMRGHEERLPPAIEISLFRIAQEAIANVIVHSQASQAVVTFQISEMGATLSIEDDGRGFYVEETLAEAREHKTVGLPSMLDHAEMLGTYLVVESMSGRGAKVELTIPRPGANTRPSM